MHMKRYAISAVIIAFIALFACGGGGGGGGGPASGEGVNKSPVADAGPDQAVSEGSVVTLDASGSTDPDDGIASYHWAQTGAPAVTLTKADAAIAQFTAAVAPGSMLTFELTVTDAGGLKSKDTCLVTVSTYSGDPKAILYAAYAGIGYMQADNASDNELLYNAMFYDLNQVTGLLMARAVTFDSTPWWKIASLLAFNTAVTFTNTQDPDTSVSVILNVSSSGPQQSTITIFAVGEDGQPLYNPDGTPVTIDKTVTKYNLICNMTVDIKGSNGYTPHDSQGNPIGSATYYGDQSVDLIAHADVDVLSGDALDVIGNELTITTSNSLRASYSGKTPFEIKYQQWNISYGFNQGDTLTNMHLLPINYLLEAIIPDFQPDLSKLADYQLYSLNGTFILNNMEAYTFDAMKYGQLEIKESLPIDGKYIALSGMINDVDVSSFGSEFLDVLLGNEDLITLVGKIIPPNGDDLLLTDVIKRVDYSTNPNIPDGLWKSGKLSLKSDDYSAEVSFNSDGSAVCSGSEQWNEPDWQDSLDPIK